MALTVVQLGRNQVSGSRISASLKITPDDSWLTAGESLDLTQYVPVIETVTIDSDGGGYVWKYDRTNKKLLAYQALSVPADDQSTPIPADVFAPLSAVSDTADLSDQTVYITVTGTRA